MNTLSIKEIEMISGAASAKEWTGMGVSLVQLGTGLVTGNVFRVATSSFMFGYNLGGAMGLGGIGSRLGGSFYVFLH